MKHLLCSLAILFFLFSCKKATLQVENAPISHKEMVEILSDMHVADAATHRPSMTPELKKAQRQMYYEAIFAKYKTDNKTFYAAYDWYLSHPQNLDSVYADVSRGLNSLLPQEQKRMLERNQKGQIVKQIVQ